MPNPKTEIMKPKVCLTIAGLDPSGGAGIIADIKTFSAFGCFATAAVASLTFQNTSGVYGAANQSAETVRRQVEPVLQDFEVSALKTGMLPTREIIEEVARIYEEYNLDNFVVDPVVRSTSGFDLIDDEALRVLIERLFPLSVVITPNIPEAERIAQMKIQNADDIKKAALIMQSQGAKNVLIKGGHIPISKFGIWNLESEQGKNQMSENGSRKAFDFLFMDEDLKIFEAEYIETNATHGTGCTLASAIAANLAKGRTLIEAVETAKRFVTEAIRTAPNLGHGHSPINHLAKKH
jgi:hydroxymethylpyrimidine kinase/phosphomethylpyrimidine kinase